MSQKLVKILVSNGVPVDKKLQAWHLSVDFDIGTRPFCKMELHDDPKSGDVEIKYLSQKGITCGDCIERIKEIKKVRL